jgi:hypothetical protein
VRIGPASWSRACVVEVSGTNRRPNKSRINLAATGRPFNRELFSIEKCRKNHRITFLCDMVKFWPEKLTKTKEAAMKDYFSFQLFMRMSIALFIGVATYSMIFGHTW